MRAGGRGGPGSAGRNAVETVERPAGSRSRARRSELWRWGFWAVLAVHLAVLYWPRTPSTGGLQIDKLVHAAVFGIVLWAAAEAGRWVRTVAVLLAVHAVGSELIQHHLLTGRSGDPADALADLAGVAIVAVVLWWRNRKAPGTPGVGRVDAPG